MTTVFDIPANDLINKVAEELRNVSEIQAPEWAEFVKTGVHKQMPPENNFLGEFWIRFILRNPASITMLKHYISHKSVLLTEPTQVVNGITRRLRSLAQGVFPII